jgi:hypothetical protein
LPHDLLLELHVPRTGNEKLEEHLSRIEILSGVRCKCEILIKNIGKLAFPGAKIDSIEASIEGVRITGTGEIAPLEPSGTVTIIYEFDVFGPGRVWIRVRARASDGQPINFYQEEHGGPVGQNEWGAPLLAVDRHLVMLVDLLSERL